MLNSIKPPIHELNIREPFFSQIKQKYKSFEVRINSPFFSNIKINDQIKFLCRSKSFNCRVVNVVQFSTFRELLTSVGFEKCLPSERSLDSAVAVYYNLPGYREKEEKFGVVAFEIAHIETENELKSATNRERKEELVTPFRPIKRKFFDSPSEHVSHETEIKYPKIAHKDRFKKD